MINLWKELLLASIINTFSYPPNYLEDDEVDDYLQPEQRKIVGRRNAHRKIVCFVTEKMYDGALTIVLSKKPKSLQSIKFEYLSDAESYCASIAKRYIDQILLTQLKVIVTREFPIHINQGDIACPYCRNSNDVMTWDLLNKDMNILSDGAANTISYSYLGEFAFNRTTYWCPVCIQPVWSSQLLLPGDEIKADFIPNKPRPKAIPLLKIKLLKEIQEGKQEEAEYELKAAALPTVNTVKGMLHKGLRVKTIAPKTGKQNTYYHRKWVSIEGELQDNLIYPEKLAKSYYYEESDIRDFVKSIGKADNIQFPVCYYPLDRSVNSVMFYCLNQEYYERDLQRYHEGEPLQIICISVTGYVNEEQYHLVKLARDLGLTHIPVKILGNYEEKKMLEKELRDKVYRYDAGTGKYISICDEQAVF